MRKTVAGFGAGLVMLMGASACGTGYNNNGYDTVVQYGYYDHLHHYHYYATPRTVHVTNSYYIHHIYQYEPHGTQHTVKPVVPRTTATKKSRLSSIFKRKSTSSTYRRTYRRR